MRNKQKRDVQADFEKDLLLNPDKVKKKKKHKRKKRIMAVLCGLVVLIGTALAAFQIVRAMGKSSLQSKIKASTPELLSTREQEVVTEEERSRWQEGWVK